MYRMYRTIYQVLASEELRAACIFRNAPVMKNRKFSLCCKMYPLILRFRFSVYLTHCIYCLFKPDWYSPVIVCRIYIP